MKREKDNHKGRGLMRYTKEAERAFFFYATIAMSVLYGLSRLLVH